MATFRGGALKIAMQQLNAILEGTASKEDRQMAQRQLDLLDRASAQDPIMAEKIAESFGFHDREVDRLAG